jgi:large subunit ribosomal protein L6
MFCAASRHSLKLVLQDPARSCSLPAFLIPAFSQLLSARCFSTTYPTNSRVGGAPISVPPDVTLKFIDLPGMQFRGRAKDMPKIAVEVTGPRGMYSIYFTLCSLEKLRYLTSENLARPNDSKDPIFLERCS